MIGVFLSPLSKLLVPFVQGNISVSLITVFITVRRGLSNPNMEQLLLFQIEAAAAVTLQGHPGTRVHLKGCRDGDLSPLQKL